MPNAILAREIMSAPDYPPPTPDSIAHARMVQERERQEVQAIDEIAIYVHLYGPAKVHAWVRNIAVLAGLALPCGQAPTRTTGE